MSYTALYRKFRPLSFGEMVGQEHITQTLKNQIIAGRVGHAYLFNGGRGTGKTSAAKILARAINCLNPKDGEPCNECEICKAAINGSLTDVVEMDAASNNSVEDIRSIREEVNFLPTLAKYRIYIIDEVHMLSTGAFNALLKTLEEPPEHVKFILATTEPQKLPATILSRCQRFDFKKISNENIIKRLNIVCKESQIDITPEALKIIASLSDGAMRDALSILERCVQDGNNQIDENRVKELVGIPKLTFIHKITKAIIEYDVDTCLMVIQEVIEDGKDLTNLLWEIIKYVKDILLYKTSRTEGIYNKEEIEQISQLANNVSKERLIKLVYTLSEIENNIKWSSQKIIMLQAGMIRLCSKENASVVEELTERLNKLEEQIHSGNIKVQSNKIEREQSTVQKTEESKKTRNSNETSTVTSTSKLQSKEYWTTIVNDFKANGKIMLYTNLLNTKAVEINDMTIGIEFPNGLTAFGKTVLEKPENMNEIIKQLSVIYGKTMNIKLIDLKAQNIAQKEDGIEELVKGLDLPINIIEE